MLLQRRVCRRFRIIGIGTHDSIGIGEDGPTHQPIAYVILHQCPSHRFLNHVSDWLHSTEAFPTTTSSDQQMLRNAVRIKDILHAIIFINNSSSQWALGKSL